MNLILRTLRGPLRRILVATIKKRNWTTINGERKEAWQLRYVDGQGVERAKQFSKKGDASAYLTKVSFEVSQGVHTPESSSITVARAGELWIERAKAQGRERSTIKQYDELTRLHINPFIGADKLSKLTMPTVEAFADGLLKTRSKAMAGKAVRALTSIITEAQRRGLVAQNVAKGVKVTRSKRDKKKIVVPPKSDLRALLDVAAKQMPDFRPLLITAIFTGLRSSELRGLRKVDVDLKAGLVTVCQRADQWGVIGSPKSEAGSRTVPIPALVVTELRAWMLRSPASKLGLLFSNSEGGVRLHSNMLNREYWPLQIAAGLSVGTGKRDDEDREIMKPKYDFHSLRHAAASGWIKQRLDLKRLTTWLGHASVQTTLDVYGHLIKDEAGDAALVAAAQAELLA